jgi:predicted nucleic acid-binding protein
VSAQDIPAHVVDSSLVYKWFNAQGETSVPEAQALLTAHAAGTRILAAPAHMPAEVMNALRYANLARRELQIAAEGLSEAEIVIVPLDADLLKAALEIALLHDITVHDALFAALAVQLDCELVTADRRQARVRECPVRLLP